jgi:hypothetical protein
MIGATQGLSHHDEAIAMAAQTEIWIPDEENVSRETAILAPTYGCDTIKALHSHRAISTDPPIAPETRFSHRSRHLARSTWIMGD